MREGGDEGAEEPPPWLSARLNCPLPKAPAQPRVSPTGTTCHIPSVLPPQPLALAPVPPSSSSSAMPSSSSPASQAPQLRTHHQPRPVSVRRSRRGNAVPALPAGRGTHKGGRRLTEPGQRRDVRERGQRIPPRSPPGHGSSLRPLRPRLRRYRWLLR